MRKWLYEEQHIKRTVSMWQDYFRPTSLAETLDLLQEQKENAKIIAGSTDVLPFAGDIVEEARITLGCLAPTVVRASAV